MERVETRETDERASGRAFFRERPFKRTSRRACDRLYPILILIYVCANVVARNDYGHDARYLLQMCLRSRCTCEMLITCIIYFKINFIF